MRTGIVFASAFLIFSSVSYLNNAYAASSLPANGQVDWAMTDGGPGGVPEILSEQSGMHFRISVSPQHLLHVDVVDNGHHVSDGFWKIGTYSLSLTPFGERGVFGADIPVQETKAFIHGFTAASSSSLTLSDGSKIRVSLAGSSVAVDAFNHYVDTHGIDLPPPFASTHASGTPVGITENTPPSTISVAPSYSEPAYQSSNTSPPTSSNHSFGAGWLGIVLFVFIAGWTANKWQARAQLKNAEKICIDLIQRHADALRIRRKQLVYQNSYGVEKTDKWEKEVVEFTKTILLPALSTRGLIHEWDKISRKIISALYGVSQQPIKTPDALPSNPDIYSPAMNPYDYERYCATLLRKVGWEATATAGSGDQGADVVASKNGNRLALQCKLYNKSVGNEAVQQVAAARDHYHADYAAVVSNADYTPGARQLAKSTKVFLLHHDELQGFADRIETESAIDA
ncbi:restriction endonuclease [Novacetimonas pomaceti]|uniref:restriction endonuclease n=1 Tax=Novacetimonas pomaceti TaxID=2021998 RepID=UPI001C2DC389|nr:restriction endonuclease [Novacetimonas pomaceti]MBV1833104.1 restriction endonuclease [Novacetimonas pomaceti]